MARDDIVRWGDLGAALGLLTRLPVRVDPVAAQARGARAAWAWPLVGAVVGALAAGVAALALWMGLPAALAAGLALATQILLTGALHEDGLADSADGLWGGWTPDRRLAIMNDSQIGTFGVVALILSLGLRWAALAALAGQGWVWTALLVAGMLSRLPMVMLLYALPPARAGGLGQGVGVPPAPTLALAIGIAVAGTSGLVGLWTLPLALAVAGVTLLWAAIARARIGGQTGDILGASQQLAEVAVLVTMTGLVGAIGGP